MSSSYDEACFRGETLHGDNFSPEAIAKWFDDEAEGYASLGAADRKSYRYNYHALNLWHGYAHVPSLRVQHVLGMGSAWGDELLPLVGHAKRATIIDPSVTFSDGKIDGLEVEYRRPSKSGRIDLIDSSVDLVVCFGVLHHIPNVSFVVREIARVLRPGSYLLLREPIVSMGDWRRPRSGLTKNERGIPHSILTRLLAESGLQIQREALVDFAPLTRVLARLVRPDVFNSPYLVRLDALICSLTRWNLRYHAVRPWQKFRPTSSFCVCRKADSAT